MTWFEIDALLFNEHFLSVLSLIASLLTLVGMVLLRPFMAKNSIANIVVILSIAGALLFLPSVGMYYGLHPLDSGAYRRSGRCQIYCYRQYRGQITAWSGLHDRLLAWIARNAPSHIATFFAVFASFWQPALSASALGTKYLNQFFVVTREVKDKITGENCDNGRLFRIGTFIDHRAC